MTHERLHPIRHGLLLPVLAPVAEGVGPPRGQLLLSVRGACADGAFVGVELWPCWGLAQVVEQRVLIPRVAGSIPSPPAKQ